MHRKSHTGQEESYTGQGESYTGQGESYIGQGDITKGEMQKEIAQEAIMQRDMQEAMQGLQEEGEIERGAMHPIEVLPVNLDAEIEKAMRMRETFNKLFNNLLQQGIDFDRIPGTDKPTLLKPGADLLCQVFHFASSEPKIMSSIEDFKKGIFSYTVSIPIVHRDTGILVSVGIGSANSYEVKYKYRYVDSEDGEKVRITNPEPADQQNTLVKMAAKRAYIDGVLKATGASRMFTQDIEDMTWLQPEKASSKQLNYIKLLYKDIGEDKALENISVITNRKVENWGDITREEASKIIESKKREKQEQKKKDNIKLINLKSIYVKNAVQE